MKQQLSIGKSHRLTLSELYNAVTNNDIEIILSKKDRERIVKSRQILERFIDDRLPVYGVNTQFGDDAYRINIKGDYDGYLVALNRKQHNVIRALACGMGDVCSKEITRATLILRAHALAQGNSGVRDEVINRLIHCIQLGIYPLMYHYGSVGASGDLIPMASIALTLMGEHPVCFQEKIILSRDAFSIIGVAPLELQMKEGLSIVNGTSFSTAIVALAVKKLCRFLPLSIAASASCAEAMLAMDSSYDPFIHETKNHNGQIRIAEFVRKCWEGSSLIRSLENLRREWRDNLLNEGVDSQEHVQDYYSLRSIAHGFGPFFENMERAVRWIEEEMNSSNDNPLIDSDANKIHHGANFLTDYIAVIADQLRSDVAKGSTWMHAILGNLVHPRKNRGLPSNLISDPNEYTGFKTLLLLVASLAIHNRMRTIPVSAVMLPTEGDNQDMVSLGTHSAFDLLEIAENYSRITAVLLLAAAQAIELRGKEKAGRTSQAILSFVRKIIPLIVFDRPLTQDLDKLVIELETTEAITPSWFVTSDDTS